MISKLFRRFAAFLHRRKLRDELENEMAAHREMMTADRLPHFGSTLRLQEETADVWGWTWLDQLRQDLAYGIRSLRRSPGFTATAIAVLSLGIGVNLAEIHFFNAAMHRLAVREPDSLCRFFRITKEGTSGNFSLRELEFYQRSNTVLSATVLETPVQSVFLDQDPEDLRCSLVSGNFFGELGVLPAYGRVLDEQDNKAGATPVVILAHALWQGRFAGDVAVVGRTIRLNNKPVQVVGVASPQFGGLVRQPTQIWAPMSSYSYLTGDSHSLADPSRVATSFFGRLKPGIPFQTVEAQFRSFTTTLQAQNLRPPDPSEHLRVVRADGIPNPKPEAILVMSTFAMLVFLVLLAACANLGNMLLARGIVREREIKIRLAVGAGRWRLIRQLLTESLLLAALASIAALAVARLSVGIIVRMIDVPAFVRLDTDWRIIAACAFLGIAATLAFGLAPALQTVRPGPKSTRARKVLVTVEVAVSCVLLILSTLLTRAVQQAFRTDLTFDVRGMAVLDPGFMIRGHKPAQARQAALDLLVRLQQVPGIDSATIVSIPPLQRISIERINGNPLYLNAVDPSYFDMMRLPLLQGRLFGATEMNGVVVSESAARRLWPNESALGKSLKIGGTPRAVAGIVKDSGVNVMVSPESVEVYTPLDDRNAPIATILVHTTSNPSEMFGALRSAAGLPGAPPLVYTIQSRIDAQLDSIKNMIAVVGSLGAVASVLALVGIFGLLAFSVAQRTREIGVRMALGARTRDVLSCVVGQYVLPVGIGAAVGIGLAAGAAKVLRSTIHRFLPFDPLSFGAGLILFACVALLASIAPLRRALRIEPSSALRYE